MSRYSSFDKKLIDIGSGPGLLLEVANQLGWVSKGYSPMHIITLRKRI